MELGDTANLLAIGISMAALVVSAFAARSELRSNYRANQTAIALDWLTRELISESFLVSEAYVLDRLRDEHAADNGVSGLPLEARGHVLRVGRYYASLGQLVAFDIVNEKLIISNVHRRMIRAWKVIEPYALREREIRQAPFFALFEHIAALAAETDIPKLHKELRLRRFPSTGKE